MQVPLSSQIMTEFISQWEQSFNSAWWSACSRWGMKCSKFPLFSHEKPTFSSKTAAWTEFVAFVELQPLKFTLPNHPQFVFTVTSWIQQESLWMRTALMTLDLEEEPTHHHWHNWERFSKVRAGFEHLQGLDLPCSHRVEIQLTQLEPFVLLQQPLRLMPLRIYYFMAWADIEAIFWSKMEFVLVSSAASFSLVRSGLHSSDPVVIKRFSFLWKAL